MKINRLLSSLIPMILLGEEAFEGMKEKTDGRYCQKNVKGAPKKLKKKKKGNYFTHSY